MFEQEIRWFALVPVAILLAFGQLFLEVCGVWPAFPFRPDLLWILVFHATLRTPPTQALAAFFVCGLVRDLMLGPRLGAACIAFTLVGWLALHWRLLATSRGYVIQALIAGWAAFFMAVIRHALDYGPLTYRLLYRVFFVSLGDGVATGLAYLPLVAVLSLGCFRPSRERSGY